MEKHFTPEGVEVQGVQIFKQCPDGKIKITTQEMDAIIIASDNNYKDNGDSANEILAFALFNTTREEADTLVDKLNDIVINNNEEPSWFLGDPDEEYVFTD